MRGEYGDITIDPAGTQCIRDYYEQPKWNKYLEEMEKLLHANTAPRLYHEEIEYLNSPIAKNEIESIMKNLLAKQNPGLTGFTAKLHQTSKEHRYLNYFIK